MVPRSQVDGHDGAMVAAVMGVVLLRQAEVLTAGGLAPVVAAVGLALATRAGADGSGEPAPWEAPLRATVWATTAAAVTAPHLTGQGPAALLGVLAAVVAAGPMVARATPLAAAALGLAVLAPWAVAPAAPWTLLEPRWGAAPSWWASAIGLAVLLPGAGLSAWTATPTRRWAGPALAAVVAGAAVTSASWWPSGLDDAPVAPPLFALVALAGWPAAGAHGVTLPAAALLAWMTLAAPSTPGWWLASGLPLAASGLLLARARRSRAAAAWAWAIGGTAAGAAAWPAPSSPTDALLTGGTAVALAWWTAARAARAP
jgi:hypothetical protein